MGKAAARLLPAGLGVASLQGGRVRQAHPGAIGDQQTAFATRAHQPLGDVRAEPAQPAHREPRTGRAIGAGGAGRQGAPLQSAERLDAGEGLFARGTGIQNLPQKGPKRHRRSKHRMPAVAPALIPGMEQLQRQPAPEKGAQLRRAEPVGRRSLPQDFLLRRDGPAAKQKTPKPTQKWRAIEHAEVTPPHRFIHLPIIPNRPYLSAIRVRRHFLTAKRSRLSSWHAAQHPSRISRCVLPRHGARQPPGKHLPRRG